jgi:hypothetical protein
MLSFKEFIILLEYAGDGNTSLNPQAAFYKPFGLGNVPGTHNDGNREGNAEAYLTPEDRTKTLQNQGLHPSYELTANILPTITVKGSISDIDWFSNKNKSSIGITIKTSGGKTTNINLTRSQYDQMKRLNNGKDPQINSIISVKMLRHPTDHSTNSSNILGIKF